MNPLIVSDLKFNGFGTDFKYFFEVDSGNGFCSKKYVSNPPKVDEENIIFEVEFEPNEANHSWETIYFGVESVLMDGVYILLKKHDGSTKTDGIWHNEVKISRAWTVFDTLLEIGAIGEE